MPIHLNIVSASETLFTGEVESVVLPGEIGEIGVLPHHTPLMTRIRPGEVRYRLVGQPDDAVLFVAGGIIEVLPERVTVLADTAVRAKDLDEQRVLEAKKNLEHLLSTNLGKIEHAQAIAEFAKVVAELRVIERFRKKSH